MTSASTVSHTCAQRTIRGGKIVEIDILADPARLRRFDLPVPHP
jgi:hypothetical protein